MLVKKKYSHDTNTSPPIYIYNLSDILIQVALITGCESRTISTRKCKIYYVV